MDNNIKSVVDVFGLYLEYLSQWNKSHSLIYFLKDIKERPHMYEDDKLDILKTIYGTIHKNGSLSGNVAGLVSVCRFEYVDTQSMTSEKVIEIEEFLRTLLVKIRDEKIDKIVL